MMRSRENTKPAVVRKRRLSKKAPRHLRLGVWLRDRKKPTRFVSLFFAVLIGAGVFINTMNLFIESGDYDLQGRAEALVGSPNSYLASSLKVDQKTGKYEYNQGYQPGGEVAAQGVSPKFSASFSLIPEQGTTVTDPVTKTSITFKPKFGMRRPIQDRNRLIYPLTAKNAVKVVSMKSIGFKEDIILNKFQGEELEFKYELDLPEGTEARMEPNGSLAIYGADYNLLGDVSVGGESDRKLLEAARKNSVKRNLLFTFPAPFIKEYGKKTINRNAWFTLDGSVLTIHAKDLKDASYPLTIDPSIYVETAAKLMRGNNETNTDFDVDNELIQKSQTTGARIDGWQGNLDMSEATWGHAATAAGGYIYRTGGRTGSTATKPQIASSTESIQNSNSTSFTMDLPATRPAGDLYIALMCYDGDQGDGSGSSNAGNTISTPSGWTKYANRNGHAAYYKVGTDQGGGNEAASYSFTGDSEKWGGVVVRVTGFNTSDPINTSSQGHSNANAQPVFPAVTPDEDSTLVIRAAGADNDEADSTAWVPSGHTSVGYGGPTGTGDCAYVSASMDSSPASGVSTGTATTTLSTLNDVYGASTIAINPAVSLTTPENKATVDWAKFNSSTLEIESPNPGEGVCSGWCTDSAYDLPNPRRGHSMVSYNGYLYVIGGTDSSCTGTLNACSTVYIAKLGANGEPQLWHPTDTDPDNWVYWYADSGLNGGTGRRYLEAVAYNNRMYVTGGQTNADATGVTTVEMADILPNGRLGSWTTSGMQALPSGAGRFMHSLEVYNDTLYTVGGFEGAQTSSSNLRNTVYYSKLNSDGTMNSWSQTSSLTNDASTGNSTARANFGGGFTSIWGGYMYIGGGCLGVNASGHCTSIENDMQIASINADGSLAEWKPILNLDNTRIGYAFVAWQGGLYRLGGCTSVNATTGECSGTLTDVDYGEINQDGEASTVATSVSSGTSPCSGSSPTNCDLPGTGNIGNMLTSTAIMNGYLYVIGGCTNNACSAISGNVAYAAIGSDGLLTSPATCPGGTMQGGMWCVDTTRTISGGVVAAGTAIFNGRIYLVGGQGTSGLKGNVYHVGINNDGSLASAWTAQTFGNIAATSVSYTFAYARANPSSAGTYPGNLFIFGGCSGSSGGIGCSSGSNTQNVYKCNIETTGDLEEADANDCSTTNQLQIGTVPGASNPGLALHSGTVYANYVYLMGGVAPGLLDLPTVRYARFDNNNNVVAIPSGGVGSIPACPLDSTDGTSWVESCHELENGRRRGTSFGYNGYFYAVGGFDAAEGGVLSDIQFAKFNVSDGSLDAFQESSVTINQRWGLSVPVSNSYAFVIGGCTDGNSPTCNSGGPTNSVQTFQIYNNDSGAVKDFTAQSDDTYATGTDRIGASAAVYDGRLYVAGGCTNIACSTVTDNVQVATLSAVDGTVGTWASTTDSTLPATRAWGQLEVAGGTLYYIGGQSGTTTDERPEIYYGTPSGGNVSVWNTVNSSFDLPDGRTKHGAAVWNNRLYVVGGIAQTGGAVSTTVYVSPQLNSGGDISSAWSTSTAFNVARSGTAVVAYANNLYLFGGSDGTNYLSDVQFAKIDGSTGGVGGWTYTTSMPGPISEARAIAANGYIYVVGGRSAASTCNPNTLITPVSANTTIASGNNPTGIGEWYETNVRYAGDRYGAAIAYDKGKIYTMGGGCSSLLTSNRNYYSTVKSQPQVAKYSRMIDTDTDVFPNSWLMNGIDNSIGARWTARYRSMHDLDTFVNPNEDCGTSATMPTMSTWGEDTNFGDVSLGIVNAYTPKNSSGGNINCARYYYFFVSIDASQTFGYPEDVERGPTITDLSLFFTSDPSKRLRHGKTFTGGEQQPLDTPCRRGSSVAGDPNYNCPLP